jgi:hypothetical protein
VKDIIMLILGVFAAGIGHFAISTVFMIYSGATAITNSSMFRNEFSLLHRLWILCCVGFVSLVPIFIFMWSPLDTSEQWTRFGAFIGFIFVEIKFKAISILSKYFINGYYEPSNN